MAQRSLPQAGSGVGDAGPYTDAEWAEYFEVVYTGDQAATQGPLINYLNELRVTSPAALTIRIHTGAGFCYGHWLVNDATNDITIAAAAASRPDRVVICQNNTNANYDGTPDYGAVCVTPVVPRNSTRLAVLYGVEPATPRPLMTPATSANAYMVELASYTITTVIIGAITDTRDFCQFSTEITPEVIEDRVRNFLVPIDTALNFTDGELTYPQPVGVNFTDLKDVFGYSHFIVPVDFVNGMTVQVVVRAPGAGAVNMNARAWYEWGGCSEAEFTHTADTGATAPVAIIAGGINNCVMSVTLTGASVGDIVDCSFERDAVPAVDTVGNTVGFKGFLVTYTADS